MRQPLPASTPSSSISSSVHSERNKAGPDRLLLPSAACVNRSDWDARMSAKPTRSQEIAVELESLDKQFNAQVLELDAIDASKKLEVSAWEETLDSCERTVSELKSPAPPIVFAILVVLAIKTLGDRVEISSFDAVGEWTYAHDHATYMGLVNTWVPIFLFGFALIVLAFIRLLRRRNSGAAGAYAVPSVFCVLGCCTMTYAFWIYTSSPLYDSARGEATGYFLWLLTCVLVSSCGLLLLALLPMIIESRGRRKAERLKAEIDRLDAEIKKRADNLSSLMARRAVLKEELKSENARIKAIATAEEKRRDALSSARKKLDALVGLKRVKNRIGDWKARVEFDRKNGIDSSRTPLNMLFLGNPGTGKTEVARIMGQVMCGLGLLPSDKVVDVTRSDLVSPYIGETAVKTQRVIKSAMGGVLFVDEAYTLMPKNPGKDTGREALEEIMKAMEDHRGELAVIFAGYEGDMSRLFSANKGLASRFPESNRLIFDDYSGEELLEITKRIIKGSYDLDIEGDGDELLLRYLEKKSRSGSLANARGARSLAEQLYETQAKLSAAGEDTRRGVLSYRAVQQATGAASTTSEDEEERAKAFKSARDELSSMIGLSAVKEWIEGWVARTAFDHRRGMTSLSSLNMLFLGNAGTGKTEVARLMGRIMYGLGLLPTPKVIEVDRGDLVGRFIGQTAPKTEEKIKEAMGGVLFVDEAYTLMPEGIKNDLGREALETIMKAMEDHRGEFAVIFAGYESDMSRLFQVNQGLASRFPVSNRVTFPDYSRDEMLTILRLFLEKDCRLEVPRDEDSLLADCLAKLDGDPAFSNARGARSLAEALYGSQAQIVMSSGLENGDVLSPKAIALTMDKLAR